MAVEIGQVAPDFTLFDSARQKVTLSEQRGKKVVIAFFPAAFTGVCEKELCTFRDSMEALNGLNAQVLAVSVDAPFANAAFAQRNQLTFPVLSDYAREATEAYGVALNNFAGMPGYTASQRAVFVVDEEGAITYTWIAPNPGVEPDYDAVKAALA
jgi:peroxiredoxin